MRILRVADLEAKPGEKVSGYVHVIGAEFGIPVTLICGEKEGGKESSGEKGREKEGEGTPGEIQRIQD